MIQAKQNKEESVFTFRQTFKDILEKVEKSLDKSQKQKFIWKIASDWDTILYQNIEFSKSENNEISSLRKQTKEKFKSLTPPSDLRSLLKELKYIPEDKKNDIKLIKSIEKKIPMIRMFDSSPSFYKCAAFYYFETLFTQEKPFQLLLNLVNRLKEKTINLLNPFKKNLEQSLSLYTDTLQKWFYNTLVSNVNEMFAAWEKFGQKEFKINQAKKFDKLVREDNLFFLMCYSTIKSLVQETCISQKKYVKKIHDNLLSDTEEVNVEYLELVAKALNAHIQIHGYSSDDKSANFKKVSEEFGKEDSELQMLIYYGDGVYNLGYSKQNYKYLYGG